MPKSRRRLTILLAGVMVLVVAGMAGAQEKQGTSVADTSPPESPDAALDRALEELVAMPGGPPGVIAVVQRGQHRETHSFGVADLQDERSLEIDDRMRLASTSKAFSGAVVLSLVSEGVLSLDDTIGKNLPGLPDAWSEVTLRQLLNHTSGLPDFSQSQDFLEALMEDPTQAPPPAELLGFVEDEPLNFEPGSQYEYSNSDNVTAGLMVEAVTGKTYEQQLQERVFRPIGLTETSLPNGTSLKEPFIHGYGDPSDQPREDLSEAFAAGWAWASGGMVSTPADLNNFVRHYVGGELFDTPTRSQQFRVFEGANSEPPGPGRNSAGLGIFRYETECGTVWGHTGNTLGYTQFMAASPDGSRSVTVSVNAQISPREGAPGVFRALRNAETLAVCAALAEPSPDTGGPALLLIPAAILFLAAGLIGFGVARRT
ncbi:MAG: serine hydrolase domain-containing protein [Rubrobacteraceae bacterium]